MADYPVIFSAPMVCALLEGRKTMTRRLAWRIPRVSPEFPVKASPWQRVKAGDRLWVRENYRYATWDDEGRFRVLYLADNTRSPWAGPEDSDACNALMERLCDDLERRNAPKDKSGNYTDVTCLGARPSIHMPRWASRLTLIVTEAKVEHLQRISEADATDEGVAFEKDLPFDVHRHFIALGDGEVLSGWTARETFASLWQRLHGVGSWDENPEVTALRFDVARSNIDTPASEALPA